MALFVEGLRAVVLDRPALERYDLFMGAVGFERRSAFLPERFAVLSNVKAASAFDNRKVESYERNWKDLEALGYRISEHGEEELRGWAVKELYAAPMEDETAVLRVGVDVSSFSRSRIAHILLGLIEVAHTRRLAVDFWYAPAAFAEEDIVDATIRVAEPVVWELAGWTEEPERPVAAIIGLGYEPGRAVGASEYLDVARTHIYAPFGVDERYDRAVRASNTDLLAEGGDRVSYYDVADPYRIYSRLESLVYGLGADYRVTLVPFGPKIFAVCAMLVSIKRNGDVGVWRFSGDAADDPVDRRARGQAYHLALELAPL